MADRDGLKPASAYPEAIYLQRTHEDGSEMLYPHDATWTETSDCGYDIKYLRADLASAQPAPHAMPDAGNPALQKLLDSFEIYNGEIVFDYQAMYEVRDALLAQPASVEPATVPKGWKLVPVEPTDEMLDAAASASVQHLIDCIKDPAKSDQLGSEENIRKTHASRYRSMLAAAPSPAVAEPAAFLFNATEAMIDAALKVDFDNEGDLRGTIHNIWNAMCAAMPARKAIDAQGAEVRQGLSNDKSGLGRFGWHPDPAIDFCIEVDSLEARLLDAESGYSKMGDQPETLASVLRAIGNAMNFKVGGDVGAVSASANLKKLHARAHALVYPFTSPLPAATLGKADERAAFEAVFPVPAYAVWTGKRYHSKTYTQWDIEKYQGKFEGFQAGLRLAQQPAASDVRDAINQHKWDRDGDKCLKCGDSDWMGGNCSIPDADFWLAVDDIGSVSFGSPHRSMANDHINEAIDRECPFNLTLVPVVRALQPTPAVQAGKAEDAPQVPDVLVKELKAARRQLGKIKRETGAYDEARKLSIEGIYRINRALKSLATHPASSTAAKGEQS